MTPDWYPAIRDCCAYWPNAPMLRQTFEALEASFINENDACIDCAKSIVEVICRVILEELDEPDVSVRPKEDSPNFGAWVGAATRVLKLGDNRNTAFLKLVSQHHKLTETLGGLRNNAGPVSHGKDGFIERLSSYHRRAAVLSADAIVAFLHQSYIEATANLARTFQYEK
jgi:Abortive infection C-terminus